MEDEEEAPAADTAVIPADATAHATWLMDVEYDDDGDDDLYPEDGEASSNVEGYSTHEEEEEEETIEGIHQEGRSLASTTTSNDDDDDDDDNSSTTTEEDGGHDYHAMYLARAEFLNSVGTTNTSTNNNNNNNETDVELGLPNRAMTGSFMDDSSADNSILSQNSRNNNNDTNNAAGLANDRTENDEEEGEAVVTRTCATRTCQGTKNILYVVLFPILIITSVAVPLVIVLFCFVLMFIALVVLLCIYYCCARGRAGDQGPIPFHVLIRQLLEAVEDDAGMGGDPASSDTPKYLKEEIQNALVRRKVVEFRVVDPVTGAVVEDVEPTDEATREDRMHQDMFPVILPTEVSNNYTVDKEEEECDDDDDDEEANKKKGQLKGFRKRMSSRRKQKSKKKVEDEVEYNKTYELRMNPKSIIFQTNPAASHSKLYLMKRTYVFSAPLEPKNVPIGPNSHDDAFNDRDYNAHANVDAYDAEPSGANHYLPFGDGDSSSSSSGFFPVIPSSSSSSSSSSSGDSSSQSLSSISFLIDDTVANNPLRQEIPNNADGDGREQAQETRTYDTVDSEDDGIPLPTEGSTDGMHTKVGLEDGMDAVLDIETGLRDSPESLAKIEDSCENSSHQSILNRAPGTEHTEKGSTNAVPSTDIVDSEDKAARNVSRVESPNHRKTDLGSPLDSTNMLAVASAPDTHLSAGDDIQASSETLEENTTGESLHTAMSTEESDQPCRSALPVPTMEITDVHDPATIAAAVGESNSPLSQSQLTDHEHRGISSYCNICLLEYEEGDIVVWSRRPDGCHHAWHEDCLLDWLKRKPSCPNCRQVYFAVEDAPEQGGAAPVVSHNAQDEDIPSISAIVPLWRADAAPFTP